MNKALNDIKVVLNSTSDFYPFKEEVEELRAKIDNEVDKDRIEHNLNEIIDWLIELTRAHKIPWFNITPGIYASTEASFLGFRLQIMNKYGSYTSAELESFLTAAEVTSFEPVVPGGKPIYYLCVTDENTGEKVIDMAQHSKLKLLKNETARHLSCPEGDGLDYFHKIIKQAFDRFQLTKKSKLMKD
jgi:hypothetical protein